MESNNVGVAVPRCVINRDIERRPSRQSSTMIIVGASRADERFVSVSYIRNESISRRLDFAIANGKSGKDRDEKKPGGGGGGRKKNCRVGRKATWRAPCVPRRPPDSKSPQPAAAVAILPRARSRAPAARTRDPARFWK